MKIAYLVLAHGDPPQLKEMIAALNCPEATFFIHIDKKSEVKFDKSMFSEANVIFIESRLKIIWGGFSIIEATLRLLRTSFNYSNFDYFILRSGQDFPLRSPREIIRFLQENKGREFILNFNLPFKNWEVDDGGFGRIDYYYFHEFIIRCLSVLNITHETIILFVRALAYQLVELQVKFGLKRNFPKGFTPYGGSQWWLLSYDCIKYVLNFVDNNKKFVNYFRYVRIPDELFFQTIIMNSGFRDNVINDNLLYTKYSLLQALPLSVNDYPHLLASKKLFARKFNYRVDRKIMDTIKDELLKE